MPDIPPPIFAEPLLLEPPTDAESTAQTVLPANDQHDAVANAIIAAGVAATVGMGWIPAFIDVGWLVATNSGMIGSLALLYRHKWTADNTKKFIERLIGDGGLTIVSIKALAAVLELTGIGLPIGIAINGTLNGAITLALGKSAHHYFKHQGEIPDDELVKMFKDTLKIKPLL